MQTLNDQTFKSCSRYTNLAVSTPRGEWNHMPEIHVQISPLCYSYYNQWPHWVGMLTVGFGS